MKTFVYKVGYLFLITSIFFISCTEDDVNPSDDVNSIATVDLILDWNALWTDLDVNATGMRPTSTARSLAYIHLAAYETAVPFMDGYTSNVSRFNELSINLDEFDGDVNLNIALNTCYEKVMDHFMFTLSEEEAQRIPLLMNAIRDDLEVGLTDTVIALSENWGDYVADRIIAYSQTDLAAAEQIYDPQPISYEPPVGEGYWTYSADQERGLFPYWSSVRTFVISTDQSSTVAPIPYSNTVGSDYYNQMMEVYEENNTARDEDNEQLWIAEFWSDDVEGLMISPPGRQYAIAGQLITMYDLGFEESLELLLKLGFSLNDAAVSTWADKYEHMVMRPSVFIQDNIDPDYETNLYRFIFWPNPTFPAYPSGHSAFASAAAGIFIDAFGDATDFTDRTHEGRVEFRGMPRQYDSFSQMAVENAYSRIPLGVHIRIDCDEGLRLGYEISDAVNNFDLTE